jgi:hypothetical protein
MWQMTPNGGWSPWGTLPHSYIVGSLTLRVVNDQDGRLVVWATGARSGQVWGPMNMWQYPWGGWAPLVPFGLDSSNRPTGSPKAVAVVLDSAGRENAFVSQYNAGIYVRRQAIPNADWEPFWTYTYSGNIVQTDAARLADGRICVFSWDPTAKTMRVGCNYPSASWSPSMWRRLW